VEVTNPPASIKRFEGKTLDHIGSRHSVEPAVITSMSTTFLVWLRQRSPF